MTGVAIGVHLLGLLAIPALAMVVYFRKYPFKWRTFFLAFAISIAVLGIVQIGIIQMTWDLAWYFEKIATGTVKFDGSGGRNPKSSPLTEGFRGFAVRPDLSHRIRTLF